MQLTWQSTQAEKSPEIASASRRLDPPPPPLDSIPMVSIRYAQCRQHVGDALSA